MPVCGCQKPAARIYSDLSKKPQKKDLKRKTSKEKPQQEKLKKSLKRKGLIRKAEENEICQENLLDNHIDAE